MSGGGGGGATRTELVIKILHRLLQHLPADLREFDLSLRLLKVTCDRGGMHRPHFQRRIAIGVNGSTPSDVESFSAKTPSLILCIRSNSYFKTFYAESLATLTNTKRLWPQLQQHERALKATTVTDMSMNQLNEALQLLGEAVVQLVTACLQACRMD